MCWLFATGAPAVCWTSAFITGAPSSSTSWAPTQVPLSRWREAAEVPKLNRRRRDGASELIRNGGRQGRRGETEITQTKGKQSAAMGNSPVSHRFEGREQRSYLLRSREGKLSTGRLQGDSNEHTEIPDKLKKRLLSFVFALPGMCQNSLKKHFILSMKRRPPFNNPLVATNKMRYAVKSTPFGL